MAQNAPLPIEALTFKPATRENVRRALAKLLETEERRQDKKEISATKLRGAGSGDQNATTTLLRLWRAGELSIADSWGGEERPTAGTSTGAQGRLDLAQRIRGATTDGERESLLHELAALVAIGDVDADEAAQIKGAMTEARQAAEARRSNEPPPEDPTRLLLADSAAMEAARAIDLIEDEARRDRVLAFIAAELEADMAANPNTSAA